MFKMPQRIGHWVLRNLPKNTIDKPKLTLYIKRI